MADGLIEILEKPAGRSAYIAGTRIRVSRIATLYNLALEEAAKDPERYIVEALPHLSKRQVRAALSYRDLHRDEIDAEIAADRDAVNQLKTRP